MSHIFLFQGMTLDMDMCQQFEKLSNFVSHYQDHKDFDGDSFYEYVFEEFFSGDHDEKEHPNSSNQNQSPSHSQHQCCHPLVFIAPTNSLVLTFMKFEGKISSSSMTSKFNSRFLETPFQPPKI